MGYKLSAVRSNLWRVPQLFMAIRGLWEGRGGLVRDELYLPLTRLCDAEALCTLGRQEWSEGGRREEDATA